MDVLLVGSDNPVGAALLSAFSQWGRHTGVALTAANSRWRSERQAKKAARKNRPDAVVDLRLAWQLASGEPFQSLDLERSHWLAKACERSAIHYLLLSSDRVFAGGTGRNLLESDPADALEETGAQLVGVEERVLHAGEQSLVLRTGPLFAPRGKNLLTRSLQSMALEREAQFDDHNLFCPVASVDVARVLAAILDQLSVGAQAQGVFHYTAGGKTTEYGFAEALLASASQFTDTSDVTIAPRITIDDSTPEIRVLSCNRLLNSFAIKQVQWRGFTNPLVRQYIDSRTPTSYEDE
ncbi:MAG: sugar nucleotide-binding protein [Pseudomonadota bacterium]